MESRDEYNSKCSVSEKQQLRQLLHDAVCLLCKNTISHDVQLSVEALIGITVDKGKDVLLISINELLDKPMTVGADLKTAEATPGDDSDTETDFVERINLDDSDSEQMTPALIKKEYVDIANNVEPFQHYSEYDDVKSEDLLRSDVSLLPEYSQYYSDQSFTKTTENQQIDVAKSFGRLNLPATVQFRQPDISDPCQSSSSFSTGTYGTTVPTDTGIYTSSFSSYSMDDTHSSELANRQMANSYHQRRLPSLFDQKAWKRRTRWAENSTKKFTRKVPKVLPASSASALVAQISTVFTCSLCGVHMTSHNSFQRHKRSHLEDVSATCDLCGKRFTRRDNMIAHRRRCSTFI